MVLPPDPSGISVNGVLMSLSILTGPEHQCLPELYNLYYLCSAFKSVMAILWQALLSLALYVCSLAFGEGPIRSFHTDLCHRRAIIRIWNF